MRSARSKTAPPSPGSVSDVLLKIVSLFLVGMVVLGMFGKLRFPGQKKLTSMKCPRCGRYRIGSGPCPCGEGRR